MASNLTPTKVATLGLFGVVVLVFAVVLQKIILTLVGVVVDVLAFFWLDKLVGCALASGYLITVLVSSVSDLYRTAAFFTNVAWGVVAIGWPIAYWSDASSSVLWVMAFSAVSHFVQRRAGMFVGSKFAYIGNLFRPSQKEVQARAEKAVEEARKIKELSDEERFEIVSSTADKMDIAALWVDRHLALLFLGIWVPSTIIEPIVYLLGQRNLMYWFLAIAAISCLFPAFQLFDLALTSPLAAERFSSLFGERGGLALMILLACGSVFLFPMTFLAYLFGSSVLVQILNVLTILYFGFLGWYAFILRQRILLETAQPDPQNDQQRGFASGLGDEDEESEIDEVNAVLDQIAHPESQPTAEVDDVE